NKDDKEPQKVYYWQGNKLDNMSRLSNASPDFEQTIKRSQTGTNTEEYLTKIRQDMAHRAAADAQTKQALVLSGQLPENPIETSETPTGLTVTLHLNVLYDENSASLKVGAIDSLDRLLRILQDGHSRLVHFTIMDRLDDSPQAADIDAERALMVLGL